MRVVSLFAGIGGFDLALTRLGHEIVYANEWDKYAAQTYEKNFGHKPDTRSITTVSETEIPSHRLLVAGFPCQAFSIAGKRGGFEDTRGTLFFEIARILKYQRPSYLLLENVKGLLSHDNGRTFETIMRTLTELGYELQWQVLNSKDFGVPQNRERVFIIGHYFTRVVSRPKVFPIRESLREDSKGGEGEVSQCLTSNYYKTPNAGNYIRAVLTPDRPIKRQNGRRIKDAGEPSFTLTGQDRHGIMIGTLRTHKDGEGFREVKSGLSPTIPARAREDGSGQPVIAHTNRVGGRGSIDKNHNWEHYMINGSIRRLTPTECERLQGFPDGWTEGVSDTQRYKQLGNAVTVNVVEEIVRRLSSN